MAIEARLSRQIKLDQPRTFFFFGDPVSYAGTALRRAFVRGALGG